MDAYETTRGPRPDLAALPTNPQLGYIGDKILPILNTQEKSGVQYYRMLTSDSTAQTGRSANAVPTRVLLTDQNEEYSCTEVMKGYFAPRDMVKQNGGIQAVDRIGGMAAKRSVERFLEAETAALVLTPEESTVYDIESSLIKAVNVGKNAMRRYPGLTAFVCSYTIFNRIMMYTEIINRFSLASAPAGVTMAEAILSMKPEALRLLLSSVLAVDLIMVGDDDQWYSGAELYKERAALVKIQPNPDEINHLMDPVFGKRVMYLPDGKQPYFVESFYDDDDKGNKYDASVWRDSMIFNPGALYVLSGIDEANSVVTSTTTTTTTTSH